MDKIITWAILVLVFVSACRQPAKQGDRPSTGLRIIDIDKFEQKNPIQECMSDIKVIPLETNSDNLIGEIKRIEVSEPYLFLLDHNKNFFTFTTDGQFVCKMAATGRGPEDISHVTNFYVDTTAKYVGIYDYLKQQVFRYDFRGKLLEVVDCKTKLLAEANEINKLPGDKLLLALDYTPELKHSFATVNCKDYSHDKFYKSFPYTWKSFSGDGTRPKQTRNQAGTYLISMLSDTLYHYDGNDFTPVWVLKSKLEPASHKNVDTTLVADFSDVGMQAYKHRNMSRGFLNILLTDSTGYSLYYYNNNANNLFWNLRNGKGTISQSFGGYPNAFMDFMVYTTSGNCFVGSVAAHKINLDAIAKDCSPEIVKILANVKEDDNPVIVFYPITVK